MRYIGKPFKTYEGARKRAAFENACKLTSQGLVPKHRYSHMTLREGDYWRVARVFTGTEGWKDLEKSHGQS